MNCEKARQAILLAQSGELPAGRRTGLDVHLTECAACRVYQTDLARMLTATRNTPLEELVSEFTLRRIEAAAARALHPVENPREAAGRLLEIWRPALLTGAAAALVLLLAVSHLQRDRGAIARAAAPTLEADKAPAALLAWDPDIDAEFESLNTLLVMAVDENGNGSQDNNDSLDSLAEELIELESWNI